MADPHSETGGGQPFRSKGESPLADSQAPGSAKKALKPTDVFAEKQAPSHGENGSAPDSESLEGSERFWQTEKFRTRSSIGLICVLLGTFGVVCYQKYRERLAKGETVASSENENPNEEPTESPDGKLVPEPLADLSDSAEPTPIHKEDLSGADLAGSNLAGSNLAGSKLAGSKLDEGDENPASLDAEPPSGGTDEAKPQEQPETAQDDAPGGKIAATPISKGKLDDPFEDPEPTPVSRSAAPPPSADPARLTKLEEIESDEPATLGKLEADEPEDKEDPGDKTVPRKLTTPDESRSASSAIAKKSKPLPISEAEENDLDQRMAGFREVNIDSRQSSGTTKIVAADPKGPAARSISGVNLGEEEFPSQESFVTPEPTRNEQKTIRTPEPIATPSLGEETRSLGEETRGLGEETSTSDGIARTPRKGEGSEGPAGSSGSDLEGELYTVRPRDTYWRISKQHYGSVRYFLALARYNRDQVPDPKLMRAGTTIRIPPAELLEEQFPELLPKKRDGSATKAKAGPQFFLEAGAPKYRVGPKDNLSVISGRYLGDESRWDEIYQLNQELLRDANRLPVGTVLSLPAEAAPQQMAREPTEIR